MRKAFALFVVVMASAAQAADRWQILPPTPPPIKAETSGSAPVNGIQLYYAIVGHGTPVVLLHGGLANSDYFGHQVTALAPHHMVILVDSRGHGRSTRDAQAYSYDLMADDVVALLDKLKIETVDIVGWSDGAIQGLDLAMRYPKRVHKIFAFGANTKISGLKDGFDQNPTFAAFIQRAGEDYKNLSKTSQDYQGFLDQISHMWAQQPNWSDADLKTITSPVLIADGDHDEGIRRDHTEYMADTIPGAGLLILPNVSHFAFLQDPDLFNAAMLDFLDRK
jgi:pimeloyl-ACP methyl ester carboxylesterase